jgi:hypothetical protein
MNSFFKRNFEIVMVIGICSIIGGIELAYFTGDADPWGTVGGFISATSLFFTVYVWSIKKG